MIGLLEQILRQALERIAAQILNYVPGFLAAAFLLGVTWIIAKTARWLLLKMVKGIAIEHFLRRFGIRTPSGAWKTPRVAAQIIYGLIWAVGVLVALDSFNSQIASRIMETAVLLFPKLLVAAAIIIAGVWLARYFGRSMLVWAVNENLPVPRTLAAGVRALLIFGAAVAAADHLNFARSVFLAAFVLVLGGIVLALAITLGLHGRELLHRSRGEEKTEASDGDDRPLWRHL